MGKKAEQIIALFPRHFLSKKAGAIIFIAPAFLMDSKGGSPLADGVRGRLRLPLLLTLFFLTN